MTSWYNETLHSEWGQRFSIDKILFEDKTEHFDLIIFENKQFGRVMALDGAIQTTEADEFVYHEMLTHVPLFAHGNAKKVLIVGGGDGGILREVCKHPVDSVTMVEIDPTVIKLSQEFFPKHSNGSFNDPRLNLIIQDAAVFMAEDKDLYDVIIVDSTDPEGPGAVLFSEEFYANCSKRLAADGILVNQNGVPFLQANELTTTYKRLSGIFKDACFYTAAVPTYAGGLMTLGWASKNPAVRNVPLATLKQRFASSQIQTNYYTPACHQASFALPAFIHRLMNKSS
ncbi:MAG: polyamine aminopropyltransferase [Pseudomonadota bacterium]